ncbi:DNA alkylation repair protein [Campylobacter rectus]|uniref:DNA alkylation repair protein n=1 Tax=Campylobacter rectus TaxID=203 RepID=UPI000F5EC3D7|nr:DNA alkylation repair protein [Campylobacter rectus]RRD53697.1 DNA alkylation repair protein [Campylobacter rectus]
MDVKGEFLEILEGLRSEKLAAFSQKLIKSPEILGVKTPELRKLAKRNFARLNLEQITGYEPFFHEEFMLKGFLIMLIKDDEAKFKLSSEFIKTMPNWAVTDGFEPKFAGARYVDALLKQALGSNLEYEKRFFYVYFMRNFGALPLERFFEICAEEKDERYYVQMAAAWCLAEVFIKFDGAGQQLLESERLSKFTHNKTISKIRDSYRVPKDVKDALLELKIK